MVSGFTATFALGGILSATVLLGALFRWFDVRGGGIAMARRLGAVQVPDRTRDESGARLLRCVAEVAIAASVPQPATFVLRAESSINAFVLGDGDGARALVATSGALDALDEAQLRAVVAHELAHVVAGDCALHMRLLVALGALSSVTGTGRQLTVSGGGRFLAPATLAGWALRALGTIGTGTAALLRASVPRRRDFAADARAVRLTRDPHALASALAAVRDARDDAPLHVARTSELAHLCFSSGDPARYRRAFATQPTPDERIAALGPHVAAEVVAKFVAPAVPSRVAPPAAALVLPSASSDRLLLLLPDERSCLAALFALFADDEPAARQDYVARLAVAFDRGFADTLAELLVMLGGELRTDRLAVVRHAASVLGASVHVENRRLLLLKLERAARGAGRTDLASHATLRLIRRLLDVEFPTVRALAAGGSSAVDGGRATIGLERMGREFALLLSLVIEGSGADDASLDRHFRRVLSFYTQEPLARRRSDEPGIVAELEAAFQVLYVQPVAIRQAFVRHCIEIAHADTRLTPAEESLLAVFAASLGVRSDHAKSLKTG